MSDTIVLRPGVDICEATSGTRLPLESASQPLRVLTHFSTRMGVGISSVALLIAAIDATLSVGGSPLHASLAGLALLLPLIELAINLIQWLSTRVIQPASLPKLNFEGGVPRDYRTVVAVQGILWIPTQYDGQLIRLRSGT